MDSKPPYAVPRAAASASASLPGELTRFIGREAELAELRARLASTRLLTLTGAGGSGKTRLALELVRRLPDPAIEVVVVELAAVTDPALLARQVAGAFAIHEEVSDGRPEALVALLRTRRALIVLDNCEHIVDACARLVEVLLRGCPELRILATSREALGVPGERAWLVPPLALPGQHAPLEDYASSEAIRLFIDRARDAVPDFQLTGQNAPAIDAICRALDGIPLAIELAAARVKVLSPEQIRDRLDDAFALLRSSARRVVPRHRTLRAAIDWSYDLLSDDARTSFRRLAVFRGGFTLAAVDAVARDPVADSADVLAGIERLVDRSLVTVREYAGEARYALLETMRQYATVRLTESGEEREIRARHAHWIEAQVARAEPHFIRTERRAWVERLLPELDNIRAALEWSRAEFPELHARLVGRLWWFWYSTRHWTEARRWIEGALELPVAREETHERAALLFAAGALAALQTRVHEAAAHLEEAAALAARTGDDRLEAYAFNYLGLAISQTGDPRGAVHSARAQRWFRKHDDLYGLRLALLIEGTAALSAGDPARAESLNLEGVAVARRFGQDRELAVALGNLATVFIHAGDPARSEALLREGLEALRRDPSWLFIGRTLDLYAEVLGARGEAFQAARLMGVADAVRSAVGARPFRLDLDRRERLIDRLRASADEREFERAWTEGAALPPDTVLAELLDDVPRPNDRLRPDARRPAPEASPAAVEPVHVTTGTGVDLDVRALGPFEVRIAGRPIPPDAWTYAKPRELLILLLLYPDGRTRDQVTHALWPAATPAQAKNSFHVTLHHLRRTLERPDWIVVQGDRYRIAQGLRVGFDAARFERQARAALSDPGIDAAQLLAILADERGDLLEGETPAWIDEHRDRLRRLAIELRLRLGERLEQADDVEAAAAIYRSVIAREEIEEEAHRRLMRLYARSGARADALRQFERLAALLRDALDAEPEIETIEVYERIRASEPV